jgi:Zn-dependent M28 family amino/carboxypeptidase
LAVLVILAAGLIYTQMRRSSRNDPYRPPTEHERVIRERVNTHVSTIAGTIGERNHGHAGELAEAAKYIEGVLSESGYIVTRQPYDVHGVTVANVEAELAGGSLRNELVVIGAHYDSVIGSPGANDNASGVGALLEIARLLANNVHARTVRFVAFTNEEPPFFQTEDMGSVRYAQRSRRRNEQIVAMLALETIGYYSEVKGSQSYPFPLSAFYPDRADFIGFVGNVSSRHLIRRAVEAFRKHTDFPAESTAAPGWMTGIGWSDHWSFWQEGYPALMVTDTALFRYDYYHSAEDTPEKIDYERLGRVVAGLAGVVAELAGGAE